MYVLKRNGGTEVVSFDKIMRRVKKCGAVLLPNSSKKNKEIKDTNSAAAAAVTLSSSPTTVGSVSGVNNDSAELKLGGAGGGIVAERKERSSSFDVVMSNTPLPREPLQKINYAHLAMKVIDQLYDKIPTAKIDELTAEQCASMSSIHPDYNTLAGRIAVSSHHKSTSERFSVVISQLYNNKDVVGEHTPLVSKELYTITKKYTKELNELCDYSRDYLIDYFGFKTLERAYLAHIDKRIVERPQHLWLRVSIGIHGDNLKKIRETYEFMSQKYFIHATPTLFNAGTPHPQLSSCFLYALESDSIDGIFNTLKDCAIISKWSGGIGLHIHNVRASGSQIRKTNGTSSGIVPMLRVFNNTARYVNQGGKRNGSFAIYLEPWHADIENFLELRKNHGEEDMKARDLFYALWVPDLFMKRVEANEAWTLFCPDQCPGLDNVYGAAFEELYNKYESLTLGRKVINARDLWYKILDSQMETGTPYLLYKDACNLKSNQKNIGTIKSSNLCVAPETMILTDAGHVEIQKLCGQKVNVWNGEEFSNVEIFKTGENQKLIEVHTSDGCVLHCTPYHKFYIQQEYAKSPVQIIEAQNLKKDDKIVKCDYPIIDGKKTMNYTYTHGFFCGDGTYYNNNHIETKCKYKCLDNHYYCKRHINYETENNIDELNNNENIDKIKCNALSYSKKPEIYLYAEKKKLVDKFEHIGCTENNDRTILRLPLDIQEKFFVPIDGYSLETKLQWFSGYCDADGCITNNKTNQQLQICSINKEFLTNIKLMLQTCGINPKISNMIKKDTTYLPDGKGGYRDFNTKPLYRLLITSGDLVKIIELGFSPKRLVLNIENQPNRAASHFIKISHIVDNDRHDDTYCFTEPNKHAGIFNGIYTSQCSEIVQYSDEKETAVCNLASIGLPTFVETHPVTGETVFNFDKLHKIVRIVTYNLNRVIDINFYPIEKTRVSNMRHRPIGIGVQGLNDTFMKMNLAFSSPEARQLNKEIFETMYHAALTESAELAEIDGAYETFAGSPASLGILQFDLWGDDVDNINSANLLPERYDWDELKTRIKATGLRNSLMLAVMPTASTSQILGFNECIEPVTSNIYSRRTLAGEFIIVNKYLMADLLKLGLWNEQLKNTIIANNGSIQHINNISAELKEKYKTVWEMSMKTLINMSADRGRYICQSQSLNLWLEDPTYDKMTSMHFYAWKKGLKTGIYYLRRRAAYKVQQFTIEPDKKEGGGAGAGEEEQECLFCSA